MSNQSQQNSPDLEELRAVFDSFDTDGNGALSRDEIAGVLRSFGSSPDDEDLAAIFAALDANLSQTIEFEEFAQWMMEKWNQTSGNELVEIFRLIDTDASGAISTNELRGLIENLNIDLHDSTIDALMQQADKDGNGLIEFDEFAKSKGLWDRIKLTLGATRSFYIQAEFDSLAREYNQLIRLWVPWYDESLRSTVDSLPSEPTAPHILDLGGGTGNLSAALRSRYPQATLHIVDNSRRMIDYCSDRFGNDKRTHLYKQEFETMDFGESTFDHIVSQISLHHLDEVTRKILLQKCHRWLKPDGLLSYSDIFRGVTYETNVRHYLQWENSSRELGATDEQWRHFKEHDERFDKHSPIMLVVDWLREIGFVDVDITWRRSLWANLIARKTRSSVKSVGG